jgi:4-nitrophenyl phosphatase/phosphoglycolate phosphatase
VGPRRLDSSDSSTHEELLASVDAFIFDCDGVVWKGESAIPGAAAALARLATTHGKRSFFVTNNSTKTRAAYKEKFDRLGLGAHAAADSILSSSFAAAAHLEKCGFARSGKLAYVVGEQGLMDELALAGIEAIGGPAFASVPVPDMADPDACVTVDPRVEAVVVGLDRGLNYYKLQYAQLCLSTLPVCQATHRPCTSQQLISLCASC